MFVILPLVRPQDAHEVFQRSAPWWSYPFFLQNFLVAAPALAAGPLGVSWSLAVEELFYLVWPFVVRFVSRGSLEWIAWAVLLTSPMLDRKSTRLNSSHQIISYAVFCLKKKKLMDVLKVPKAAIVEWDHGSYLGLNLP